MRIRILWVALFSSCTCLDPVWEGYDGGDEPDAGGDAGVRDAGARDAGPDGGALDGGGDAGPLDAGAPDAGPTDGGDWDGGVFDGGPGDAGIVRAIEIVSAIYGSNCGLTMSNDMRVVALCSGETTCEYRIDIGLLGDPAPGCTKAHTVQYRCEPGGPIHTARQSAESTGKLLFLDCASPDGDAGTIRVEGATYGASCPQAPIGNAWHALAQSCNARPTCSYTVLQTVLGEPAFGCAKSFSVEWSCIGTSGTQVFNIPAEANGQTASLTCP